MIHRYTSSPSGRRWGKANRSPEYVVPGPVPPKADTIAPQPQPDRDRPGHKDRTGDLDAPGELLPTTPLSNVSPIASYLRRAAAAAVPRRRTKAKVRYGPLLPILAYSATPTGPCTPDDFRVSADDPQCLVLAQGVGVFVCLSLSDGVSFYVWIFCMILWFPCDFGSLCVCVGVYALQFLAFRLHLSLPGMRLSSLF